jgi:hypothetical protein
MILVISGGLDEGPFGENTILKHTVDSFHLMQIHVIWPI